MEEFKLPKATSLVMNYYAKLLSTVNLNMVLILVMVTF